MEMMAANEYQKKLKLERLRQQEAEASISYQKSRIVGLFCPLQVVSFAPINRGCASRRQLFLTTSISIVTLYSKCVCVCLGGCYAPLLGH
jgi:hypothetical protein